MAHMVGAIGHSTTRVGQREQATASVRFDWTMTVLSGALVGGTYLDAWAHEHGRVDQSFFTPWHGILYSAMLAVGLFLFGAFARGLQRGAAWRRALPVGYGLSLIGTLVFAAGGVGDMIWHILFGIESNLEALLSPTHLLLALGWVLIVGGPLRAAWQREDDTGGWSAQLPKIISLAFILAVFAFFTVYANPFAEVLAAPNPRAGRGEIAQALGVSGVLLQPALMMGLVLLALRRWSLPVGSLTLILTISTALVSVMHDRYLMIVVGAVAGLLADLLYHWLRPTLDRPRAVRLFAFGTPAILYALYFLALFLTSGIWWSIHLWAGAIFLAGVVGLLLSYLLMPPPGPFERRQPDMVH